MHILMFPLLLGVTALLSHSVYSTYTYTCYPNNTITVSGLPTNFSSMNYFATQDAGKNCTVTGVQADGTAEITDCDKNEPIYFTFGYFDPIWNNQIHGSQDVEIVNITCYEISDTGEPDTISDTLASSIDFKEEAGVNVTWDVTSALNPTSANVGESVTWTINYPLNYSLQITTCKAYPGTSATGPQSVVLISDWCTSESELISNFSSTSNTVATATIHTFKFFNNDNVFLKCDVLVCPEGSSSCITSCGGRKRRSSGDNNGDYGKSVGKVLHIIDHTSAASRLGSSIFLPVLLMTQVSLL